MFIASTKLVKFFKRSGSRCYNYSIICLIIYHYIFKIYLPKIEVVYTAAPKSFGNISKKCGSFLKNLCLFLKQVGKYVNENVIKMDSSPFLSAFSRFASYFENYAFSGFFGPPKQ